MLNLNHFLSVKMTKDDIHRSLPAHDEISNHCASNANNPRLTDLNRNIPNTTDGQFLRIFFASHQNPDFLEQIILAHEDNYPQWIPNWCLTSANLARSPTHSYQPNTERSF